MNRRIKTGILWMILAFALCPTLIAAQTPRAPKSEAGRPKAAGSPLPTQKSRDSEVRRAEKDGIEVRIKDIAHFRGVRSNQLMGYGLVVGLEGTGDSKKTPFTATLLANAMKKFGTMIDPTQMDAKNVATVAITAELPPFSTPGNRIDVTVQSVGDAKSLQGGTLLQAPLFGASDDQKAIAVAQGPISLGGFNFSSGGSSVQKNHVNVGRIPGGANVEAAVPYQMVFDGNRMYLELDDADLTTAKRLESVLKERFPQFVPFAVDGGTLQLSLPSGTSAVQAMSQIETTTVYADIAAIVVVNERTGTIVIGGNVKIGPAAVARGSLRVVIDREPVISQPNSLGTGETVVTNKDTVGVKEDTAQIGVVGPSTTLNDLAKLFQTLRVSAQDIIAILQALKEQGALKARIKLQ